MYINILLALYTDAGCQILFNSTILFPGICAFSKYLATSMFTEAVFGNN